jgi:hypothetical protein
MVDEPSKAEAGGPAAAGLETVVDDVFGFDFKLPRTLRDLAIRPGLVADAALAGGHSRYMRPLRVLLLVYALQLLLTGWLGYNSSGTFSVIFADDPAALSNIEAQLVAAGTTLADADALISKWTSWTSWPLITFSSFLFVLVIWATRPRLGPIKSTLLYIIANSASNTVTLPLTLVGGLVGPYGMLAAASGGFVVLFVYAGLVMHKRVASSALGLAARLVAFVLATIPVLVVGITLVFIGIELAFSAQTGLSRLGLIAEQLRSGG